MKVAIVQIRSSLDKYDNLKRSISYIKEASKNGAKMIAFPEFLMSYSPITQTAKELYEIAESIEGEFVSSLLEAAKENNITVIATIYEKSNIDYKVYDTALFINDKRVKVYRKLHLYDALGFKESDKLVAGDKLPTTIDLENTKIGMMICYDLRFPELARLLALDDARIIVAPSAWVSGEKKVEHWQVMLRARAIENGCYVLAPDQTGNIYIGRSMIINPYGDILLDMMEEEGIGIVELDLKYLDMVRDRLPLLKNRRSDLYSIDIRFSV
ncbi:MAG: carbon-nitrogen hydrolase family protein [Candidatus Nitrosocaldaceae archaeon]